MSALTFFWFWLIAFALAGFLIARWWLLVALVTSWVAIGVFLIANNGWYGHGWGEFGIAFNVMLAVGALLSAALGIAVRRFAAQKHRKTASKRST
jgi:hypothetical protein